MAYITPITFSMSPLCLCCIHLSCLHLSLKFHQIIKLPASSISAVPFLVSKFGHPFPILSGCHTLPLNVLPCTAFFSRLYIMLYRGRGNTEPSHWKWDPCSSFTSIVFEEVWNSLLTLWLCKFLQIKRPLSYRISFYKQLKNYQIFLKWQTPSLK